MPYKTADFQKERARRHDRLFSLFLIIFCGLTSALTTHTTTFSRTPAGAGIGAAYTSYAALFCLDEGMHGCPHNNKQNYNYDHICHLLFLFTLLYQIYFILCRFFQFVIHTELCICLMDQRSHDTRHHDHCHKARHKSDANTSCGDQRTDLIYEESDRKSGSQL